VFVEEWDFMIADEKWLAEKMAPGDLGMAAGRLKAGA
jgi:hypothetical protein